MNAQTERSITITLQFADDPESGIVIYTSAYSQDAEKELAELAETIERITGA